MGLRYARVPSLSRSFRGFFDFGEEFPLANGSGNECGGRSADFVDSREFGQEIKLFQGPVGDGGVNGGQEANRLLKGRDHLRGLVATTNAFSVVGLLQVPVGQGAAPAGLRQLGLRENSKIVAGCVTKISYPRNLVLGLFPIRRLCGQ